MQPDFPRQRLLECNPDSLLSRPLGGSGEGVGEEALWARALPSRPSLSRKAGEDAVPRALGSQGACRREDPISREGSPGL